MRASQFAKRAARISKKSADRASHLAHLGSVKACLEGVLVSGARARPARASMHATARAARNGRGAAFAPRPRPGTAAPALQHRSDVSGVGRIH